MEILKKFRASSYAVSIIYIIVGIIMLLNPSFISHAVNYVIGVLVIIYGLIYSVSLYQKGVGELHGSFDFLAGIICISFGLFLILYPEVLFSLIPFCTGVIIFMDAVRFIFNSITLKRLNFQIWKLYIIMGVSFLIFSIVVIVNAKSISFLLIRIIGGFLIIDAILDVFLTTKLRNKEVNQKVIEASVSEKEKIEED